LDAIIDKTLRPGQHLNEVKLAATYSVPRSRVRRVLERLRDEAVVEIELNRGAFISRPTIAEARDVFEARKNLEMIIVRLACERATPADIARLRDYLLAERATSSIICGQR
jgi:DNA-binding GntR family transcriptional regulator